MEIIGINTWRLVGAVVVNATEDGVVLVWEYGGRSVVAEVTD